MAAGLDGGAVIRSQNLEQPASRPAHCRPRLRRTAHTDSRPCRRPQALADSYGMQPSKPPAPRLEALRCACCAASASPATVPYAGSRAAASARRAALALRPTCPFIDKRVLRRQLAGSAGDLLAVWAGGGHVSTSGSIKLPTLSPFTAGDRHLAGMPGPALRRRDA
jgi:hypothetical protein